MRSHERLQVIPQGFCLGHAGVDGLIIGLGLLVQKTQLDQLLLQGEPATLSNRSPLRRRQPDRGGFLIPQFLGRLVPAAGGNRATPERSLTRWRIDRLDEFIEQLSNR